jgi:hypothetical protein
MTSVAMGLSSIDAARRFAAQKVLLQRYGLHMTGVDAASVSAQVVDRQKAWDFPHQRLIDRSVGWTVATSPSIPVGIDVASPFPAVGVLVDFVSTQVGTLQASAVSGHEPDGITLGVSSVLVHRGACGSRLLPASALAKSHRILRVVR